MAVVGVGVSVGWTWEGCGGGGDVGLRDRGEGRKRGKRRGEARWREVGRGRWEGERTLTAAEAGPAGLRSVARFVDVGAGGGEVSAYEGDGEGRAGRGGHTGWRRGHCGC